MDRIHFEDICMNTAVDLSKRSSCTRLQVGTVIASEDYRQIYSWGYNGGAAGLKDKCTGQEGNCGCLHSEINAIINCNAPRGAMKVMHVTVSPCAMCAKAIINLGGVYRIYYKECYRSTEGLILLANAKVEILKL